MSLIKASLVYAFVQLTILKYLSHIRLNYKVVALSVWFISLSVMNFSTQ